MLKARVQIAEATESQAIEFEIQKEKDQYQLNGSAFEWDLIKLKDDSFHIIKDHQSYLAEIVQVNREEKLLVISVNGTAYQIQLQDRFDLLLKKLGMKSAESKVEEVKAPMPGLILDIKVEEGQAVKKGDTLIILEAMKMENVIKSPTDGNIKTIRVKPQENVEKNQVLILFG